MSLVEWMAGRTGGCMGVWIGGRMAEWVGEWMDGQMDSRVGKHMKEGLISWWTIGSTVGRDSRMLWALQV